MDDVQLQMLGRLATLECRMEELIQDRLVVLECKMMREMQHMVQDAFQNANATLAVWVDPVTKSPHIDIHITTRMSNHTVMGGSYMPITDSLTQLINHLITTHPDLQSVIAPLKAIDDF